MKIELKMSNVFLFGAPSSVVGPLCRKLRTRLKNELVAAYVPRLTSLRSLPFRLLMLLLLLLLLLPLLTSAAAAAAAAAAFK